jgi:hypothetical protein
LHVPSLTLIVDVVTLELELLMLATEHLNLNQKWSGHVIVVNGGNPPHEVRLLAIHLCYPLVQGADVGTSRIDITQSCHFIGDYLRVRKHLFDSSPNLGVESTRGNRSWRTAVNITIAGLAAIVRPETGSSLVCTTQ